MAPATLLLNAAPIPSCGGHGGGLAVRLGGGRRHGSRGLAKLCRGGGEHADELGGLGLEPVYQTLQTFGLADLGGACSTLLSSQSFGRRGTVSQLLQHRCHGTEFIVIAKRRHLGGEIAHREPANRDGKAANRADNAAADQ